MGKPALGIALLLSVLARPALAQNTAPPPVAPPAPPAGLASPAAGCACLAPAVDEPAPDRVWLAGDYMLRWLKPVCLTRPVLTVGNPADQVPGAIGQPGTKLIIGDHKFEFDGVSGGRVTLGVWLSSEPLLAFEASGFLLPRATARLEFHSSNGSPASYLAFQTPTNAQDAVPFSVPGSVDGRMTASGSSELWGAEANVTCGFTAPGRNAELRATLLAGFRYLDLHDEVRVADYLNPVGSPSAVAFGEDEFTTRNQFYGSQVGCKLGVQWEKFAVEYVTKMAVGITHQVTIVNGSPLIVASPADPTLLPGPFLALPSNIGRLSSNRVTLVPELALRCRWQMTDHVALRLGYELLYWNKILCPGDQMDPHANLTQIPGRGPVVGDLVPARMIQHTDFFAQGLDAGIELRY